MQITEVLICPTPNDQKTSTLARVKIVLDSSFVISGIKVIKGKFGMFIAWPRNDHAKELHAFPISARLESDFNSRILIEFNNHELTKAKNK